MITTFTNALRRIILISTMVVAGLNAFLSPAFAGDLPDPALTPGATVDTPLDVLCHTKTNLTRNVPASLKKRVFAAYGLQQEHRADCTGPGHACYEIDHLNNRKLGGADVFENLWPQAYDGTEWNAHLKDKLEDRLSDLVCNGEMTQQAAQECIATNWINCYQEIFK